MQSTEICPSCPPQPYGHASPQQHEQAYSWTLRAIPSSPSSHSSPYPTRRAPSSRTGPSPRSQSRDDLQSSPRTVRYCPSQGPFQPRDPSPSPTRLIFRSQSRSRSPSPFSRQTSASVPPSPSHSLTPIAAFSARPLPPRPTSAPVHTPASALLSSCLSTFPPVSRSHPDFRRGQASLKREGEEVDVRRSSGPEKYRTGGRWSLDVLGDRRRNWAGQRGVCGGSISRGTWDGERELRVGERREAEGRYGETGGEVRGQEKKGEKYWWEEEMRGRLRGAGNRVVSREEEMRGRQSAELMSGVLKDEGENWANEKMDEAEGDGRDHEAERANRFDRLAERRRWSFRFLGKDIHRDEAETAEALSRQGKPGSGAWAQGAFRMGPGAEAGEYPGDRRKSVQTAVWNFGRKWKRRVSGWLAQGKGGLLRRDSGLVALFPASSNVTREASSHVEQKWRKTEEASPREGSPCIAPVIQGTDKVVPLGREISPAEQRLFEQDIGLWEAVTGGLTDAARQEAISQAHQRLLPAHFSHTPPGADFTASDTPHTRQAYWIRLRTAVRDAKASERFIRKSTTQRFKACANRLTSRDAQLVAIRMWHANLAQEEWSREQRFRSSCLSCLIPENEDLELDMISTDEDTPGGVRRRSRRYSMWAEVASLAGGAGSSTDRDA